MKPRWGRQPRPLIIAHRGASAEAPENSLAAFTLARSQGADGVELDVMRCASGEVVVFHDDDLARFGGSARDQVRRLSWSALSTVELGGGQRIPSLSSVFETLGELLINVELKSEPGFWARWRDDGLAREVAHLVRRHGARARVLVSSFDPWLLGRFARLAPEVPTGLLFAADQSLPLRRAWAARVLAPCALHPEAALICAPELRRWHQRGLAVHAWTVDHPAELRALAALGVDALITNLPALARRALAACVIV